MYKLYLDIRRKTQLEYFDVHNFVEMYNTVSNSNENNFRPEKSTRINMFSNFYSIL